MKTRLLLIVLCSFISSQLFAQTNAVVVMAGDTASLIDAIHAANASGEETTINLVTGPNGETEFVFTGQAAGSNNALPDITGQISIVSAAPEGVDITFRPDMQNEGNLRLLTARDSAFLGVQGVNIENFGTQGSNDDGGAILATGSSRVYFRSVEFSNNTAGGRGGAFAAQDSVRFGLDFCSVMDNQSSGTGGGISVTGNAEGFTNYCIISENRSGQPGSALYVNSNVPGSRAALSLSQSQVDGNTNTLGDNPNGDITSRANTWYGNNGTDLLNSTAWTDSSGSVFAIGAYGGGYTQQSGNQPPSKIEALCNDFGTNAFMSFGFNIDMDGSCGLNQDTDLPNTDPMIERNADGLWVAEAGSPIIDAGASEVMQFPSDEFLTLPCGYRDIAGTARPQDGNNDGVFECDMGAMEVQGAGDIVAGHSGAFFNALRDGEGTYVEILNDTTAVVYTFTYRPDGSGPAWFVGVGTITENGIVIDDLLRPIGTSFGAGFDAADVDFTPIGGMSMVFPDCEATAAPGNVAYSGEPDLEYEGLITRATRLSNITGCSQESTAANAGLSGSYFDPARDGEGIIVEWLPNGDVLVVFFTYDQNDNQLWLIGIGQANGNTVTMDALYASAYTQWGSEYDANDKVISNWGTFTLTWTECNAVVFDYSSTVMGFGSATHNYQRLSTLQGTSCPQF